jgi:5-formyltetrahydrofolate cyclo-ligase
MTATNDAKSMLRKEYLRRRNALPDAVRRAADGRIRDRLAALPELQAAPAVAAFYPTVGEPDLRPLLADLLAVGKTCCFPRSDADGTYRIVVLSDDPRAPFEACFQTGRFGIPEPRADHTPPPDADLLWLIPGVAFDPQGHRLGRGGGVYDRLLRDATGLRIAVAYETQIASAVPVGPDDQPVHRIVTEADIRRCPPPSPERKTIP